MDVEECSGTLQRSKVHHASETQDTAAKAHSLEKSHHSSFAIDLRDDVLGFVEFHILSH